MPIPRIPPPPGGTWPNHKRYPIARRLFALWRWEHERGPDSIEASNARKSIENRGAALGIDILG